MSHRFDRQALPLADRHYNRRKVGSPQYVPPGRCVCLLSVCGRALWVSSWPFAQYVRHRWPGTWVNSLFRNEGAGLSSELVIEALAATRAVWGEPPALGLVTFVDARKIRSTNPGFCYLQAGGIPDGYTEGGLRAIRFTPDKIPPALAPIGFQPSMVE